jgi:hypothetical protein
VTELDGERLAPTEADVSLLKLQNRPGEIARAASRPGEANINVNCAYCGLKSGTNAPLVFFGVTEVGRAAQILEQAAGAAATP